LKIKENLMQLDKYARNKSRSDSNILLAGTTDKHFGTKEYKERETELKKWGGPFGDHAMVNTTGQKKIEETKYLYTGDRLENKDDYFHPHYLDEHVDENLLRLIHLLRLYHKPKILLRIKNVIVFRKRLKYP